VGLGLVTRVFAVLGWVYEHASLYFIWQTHFRSAFLLGAFTEQLVSFVARGGLNSRSRGRVFNVPCRVLLPLANGIVYLTVLAQQLCVQLWRLINNTGERKHIFIDNKLCGLRDFCIYIPLAFVPYIILRLVEIFGYPQSIWSEYFCTSWNPNCKQFSLKVTLKPCFNWSLAVIWKCVIWI